MTKHTAAIALVVVAGLLAVACGGERESETTATTAAADATTAAPAGAPSTTAEGTATTAPVDEAAVFGDAPWPCGPGDASAATDQGVTAGEIVIGAGDDRGYAGSPGLNKAMTDALEAMAAACNDLGGINGRPVRVVVYDAAVTNVGNIMLEACDQVFMMVGHGFSLDNLAEEVRVGCGLPAVPAFSVSPEFAHGPLVRQPVPNPADRQVVQAATWLAEQFPEEVAASATMAGNFAATRSTRDKVLATYPEVGFEFGLDLEYDIAGEADWSPFVIQLRDAGVQLVYFSGTCLPQYQGFRRSAQLNGFEAVYHTETNFYEDVCADANTDGALDGTYIRMAFVPLEEADVNPATGDFVDLATAAGVEPSLLGVQAASAFLLWATAASACGDDLTRECVLDRIDELEEWTGHGLHIAAYPGENRTSPCGMVVELRGTEYVRVEPSEPGTFDCDPAYEVAVDTTWVDAVALDENRVSTLYTVGD